MRTVCFARPVMALGLVAVLAAGCGDDDDQVVLEVPESPNMADDALHSPGIGAKPPLGLPVAGTYAYDVTGKSGSGQLPAQSSLTVEDLQEYRQRWILERPESGGQNTVDTLEIVAQYDGLRLASRTLSQATASGPLVIDFVKPQNPLLFVPHYKKPGEWVFDLDSADGCFTLNTTVFVREPNATVPVGTATYTAYHVELVTSLTSLGKAGCKSVDLKWTEKLWLDRASAVPVKAQTIRQGKLDGVSLVADVTTDVRSTEPS